MDIINRYKTSEILRGLTATTFWQGSAKVILVLTTLYCSNNLSTDDFGVFSYIKNTLNIVVLMCATNFSSLCTKFAAESVNSIESLKKLYILFLFVSVVSLIFGVSVYVLPDNIISDYLGDIRLVQYIKFIGIMLPIFILQPLLSGLLTGYKEFSLVGKYEFVSSLICFILLYLGIYVNGVHGAIFSLLLYYFIFSIIGAIVLYNYNKKYKLLYRVSNVFSEWRALYVMIIPVFLMSFVEAPVNWMGQTLVATHSSYAAVGVLTVITQIRTFTLLLPSYFFNTFMPFVTELNQKERYDDYFKKFHKVMLILLPICFFSFIVLALVGNFLLCLFNKDFVQEYTAYIVGIALIPLLLIQILYKMNLLVREHQRIMLLMMILGGGIMILSLYIMIEMGVDALVAFFTSQIFQYVINLSICLFVFYKDKGKLVKI